MCTIQKAVTSVQEWQNNRHFTEGALNSERENIIMNRQTSRKTSFGKFPFLSSHFKNEGNKMQ